MISKKQTADIRAQLVAKYGETVIRAMQGIMAYESVVAMLAGDRRLTPQGEKALEELTGDVAAAIVDNLTVEQRKAVEEAREETCNLIQVYAMLGAGVKPS